ncbi:MAG: hypothetical protein IKI11_04040 [Neisseriaceae bacterium]|nr:hypothetical protein [Neisseriaceae bacterium]
MVENTIRLNVVLGLYRRVGLRPTKTPTGICYILFRLPENYYSINALRRCGG